MVTEPITLANAGRHDIRQVEDRLDTKRSYRKRLLFRQPPQRMTAHRLPQVTLPRTSMSVLWILCICPTVI